MMKSKRGFSMIEMMISTAIISVVMAGMYLMMLSSQKSHMSEGMRADMLQSSRFFQHLLSEKIRSAGSTLAQVNLSNFETTKRVYFMGVYPLNNSGFPDGIILAGGDPNVVTKIAEGQVFVPGDTNLEMDVHKWPVQPNLVDNSEPEWKKGDIGIILTNNGYYVFRVTVDAGIGDTSLSIRDTAVYFSGLLNTSNYKDEYELLTALDDPSGGNTGAEITYPEKSPIIKLDYFQIYLVSEDSSTSERILTLTTDTFGLENPLDPDNAGATMGVPIANIIDLQFEYIDKDNQYWCSLASVDSFGDPIVGIDRPCASGPASGLCHDFYKKFKYGQIIGVAVSIALRTELEVHRSGPGIRYNKPPMGDSGGETLTGKYRFSDFQFEVLLRNFNNK